MAWLMTPMLVVAFVVHLRQSFTVQQTAQVLNLPVLSVHLKVLLQIANQCFVSCRCTVMPLRKLTKPAPHLYEMRRVRFGMMYWQRVDSTAIGMPRQRYSLQQVLLAF